MPYSLASSDITRLWIWLGIDHGKTPASPALDLSRLPELLSRIDGYKGQPVTRLAVMLNLLVFIRSSELRYARWSEIDIDNAMDYSSRTRASAGVKFLIPGLQDANTTSCATQPTGCSHTGRTSDMGR